MKDYILDNGLKLIYKKNNSELSSIAISLDAGAARDGRNHHGQPLHLMK